MLTQQIQDRRLEKAIERAGAAITCATWSVWLMIVGVVAAPITLVLVLYFFPSLR